MNGVVSHITSQLSIQLNGSGTPYLFKQVRPHTYRVGDFVDCKMDLNLAWMKGGVVSHTSPLSIQLNGSGTPYHFRYVRPYGFINALTGVVTTGHTQTTVPTPIGTKVITSETQAPALEPR